MRPEIQRARELRRSMSSAELMLWSRLKRLRERGYAFRRQFPFRGYFLDFVCRSYRLVVEVDGAQHNEPTQAAHDAMRDQVLNREGFHVIRVPAGEVMRNLAGVMDGIVLRLESIGRVRGGSKTSSTVQGHPSP